MEDNENIDGNYDHEFQDDDIMPANSAYIPSETDEDDGDGLPYLLRGAELISSGAESISSSDSDEDDDYMSEMSDSEEERDVPDAALAWPRDWLAEVAQPHGAVLGVGRPDAQYFLDQGVQGADVPRGADVAERGGDVPRHADYLEMEADASDVDDVNSEDEYDLLQDDGDVDMGDRPEVALNHMLRLVARGPVAEQLPIHTHDRLLDKLRRQGVLHTGAVYTAMRVCRRDAFVGNTLQRQALVDAPIRVNAAGFNISAPHMHACCLEAMQLGPGHRFLDVGSGCGLLTACGAMLVGPTGSAVGIDMRQSAIDMATDSVQRLMTDSPTFAAVAAPLQFGLHNVFMLNSTHKGQYDRVHVGASCPPRLLPRLLCLLRPEGGMLVTPVAPSDLRLITVDAAGNVNQRVLSQVRYGELEVPGDAEIVLWALASERPTALQLPSSRFSEDVAEIHAASAAVSKPPSSEPYKTLSGLPLSPVCALETPFVSTPSDASGAVSSQSNSGEFPGGQPAASSPLTGRWRRIWGCNTLQAVAADRRNNPRPQQVADAPPSFDEHHAGEGASEMRSSCWPASSTEGSGEGLISNGGMSVLYSAALGPPDYTLEGAGDSIPVHRVVLCVRSDLLRARCGSGMRDAGVTSVPVPHHFSRSAMVVLVRCMYTDTIDMNMEPAEAAEALQVGLYYGAQRLVSLCEVVMAATLTDPSVSPADKAEAAPVLLAVADEASLPSLRAAALDWLVHNFPAAAATAGYRALSKQQTDQVAAAACALLQSCQDHLQGLFCEGMVGTEEDS